MWPVPIFIAVWFAPESPWWLVRRGRLEEAERSIRRLSRNSDDVDPAKVVAMMVHTTEIEKTIVTNTEGTSYFDCFRGTNLRRTEITVVVWAIQTLCGSSFTSYSTYFYEQAGLDPVDSFDMGLGGNSAALVGTILAWFFLTWFGRRTLYMSGLTMMCVILFVVGFLSFAPDSKAVAWTTPSLFILFTFIYDLTIGPVCYTLVSEVSSTRLRQKTIIISRNIYNVLGIIFGILTPYMVNPTAWNWRFKTGFFWGCVCFCCLTWCFFRLPEPKGLTYGEMDVLFEQRVSARRFRATPVDQFATHSEKSRDVEEE